MNIEIKNRSTGKIIISGEYESVSDAISQNTGANFSEADLSEADLSGADIRRANFFRANLFEATLFGANFSEANFSEADLSRADLSRADLSGADLSGANLSRANFSGATLFGANFSGADIREIRGLTFPIIFVSGSIHFFQYLDMHIGIGGEFYHIEYWKIMYDVFGRENGYTEEQIKEYHGYIKMCDNL